MRMMIMTYEQCLKFSHWYRRETSEMGPNLSRRMLKIQFGDVFCSARERLTDRQAEAEIHLKAR